MPHRRYQGKIGIIKEIGKRIIKVSVAIGNKEKILQTKRNHLKPLTN
jgi:large subunit ribosomal protein L21e